MTEPYEGESVWSGELVEGGHVEFQVKTMKSVIELRPSWWRHPIRRWKLRHLLPDMEEAEHQAREMLGDEVYDEFQHRMDDAFLNGTGDQPPLAIQATACEHCGATDTLIPGYTGKPLRRVFICADEKKCRGHWPPSSMRPQVHTEKRGGEAS
jgi:hypothetical protein